MLCLHDSIRHDDPTVQCLLHAVEHAHSLTALILAAWQVARVLTVHLAEAVLAERAPRPLSLAPLPGAGPLCGVRALPRARSPACLDRSSGADGSAAVPGAVSSRRWRLWMRRWGCSRISGPAGTPVPGMCLGRLYAVCDRGPVAGLVQR